MENLFGSKKKRGGVNNPPNSNRNGKKKKTVLGGIFGSKKTGQKGIGKKLTYVALMPFKKPMKKALDDKGIKYNDKIGDISEKFFTYVVKGKPAHFDDGRFNLESKAGVKGGNVVGGFVVGEVVKAILDFFAMLKQRKENGDTLSKTEQTLLNGAENGLKDFQQENNISTIPTGGLVIGGLVLAYLIFR